MTLAHGETQAGAARAEDHGPRQLGGAARATVFLTATLVAYGSLTALHRGIYTYEDARYWAGLHAAGAAPSAARLAREQAALAAAPKPISASMAELARSERSRPAAITPEGAVAPPIVGWVHGPTFEAALAAQRAWRANHGASASETRGTP
jgi:hypothetical protein